MDEQALSQVPLCILTMVIYLISVEQFALAIKSLTLCVIAVHCGGSMHIVSAMHPDMKLMSFAETDVPADVVFGDAAVI